MSSGRRKPSSRNNTRYWRKKNQTHPISPVGGGLQGGLVAASAQNNGGLA